MQYNLYQIYWNTVPVTDTLAKVGGTEQTLSLIETPVFEQTLDIDEGSFKVSNIAITCIGLDRDYFSDIQKKTIDDRPYVLEILDNSGSLFWHGIVEPTSVSYSRTTRLTTFTAVGWEYYLSLSEAPARSVYTEPNANLRPAENGGGTRLQVPDTTPLNKGDVVVVKSDGEDPTEFRAIVMNIPSVVDNYQVTVVNFRRSELVTGYDFDLDATTATSHFQFLNGNRLKIEKLGDGNDDLLSGVIYNIVKYVRSLYTPNVISGGGTYYFRNGLTFKIYNSSNALIYDANIVGITRLGFFEGFDRGLIVELDKSFVDWESDDSHPGDRWEIEYTSGSTISGSKEITILGKDMYGYSGEWEGVEATSYPKTYYDVETLIEAMTTLIDTPTGSSPFGILPHVMKATNPVITIGTTATPILHRYVELPDNPLEALRVLQLSGKFFLRFVPSLDGNGMPRFGIEIIPRSEVNPLEAIPTDTNGAVIDWSEKPAEKRVRAVVVKPNKNYLSSSKRGEIVGWYSEETDTLEDGTNEDLRALYTRPTGNGVIEITVAAFPSLTGYQYYGDGKEVYNDTALKEIARYYFEYWRGDINGSGAGYRTMVGSAVIDFETDNWLGKYVTFTDGDAPNNIAESVFVTKQSIALDGQSYVMNFEGKIGQYTPPAVGTPVAVITGYRAVYDTDSNGSEVVEFSAEQSVSPGDLPLTYLWERKTKGGGVYAAFSTESTAVLGVDTFAVGEWDIRLTVNNGTNSDTEEAVLSVLSAPYEPEIDLFVYVYKFDVIGNRLVLGFNCTKPTRSFRIEYSYNGTTWQTPVDVNGDQFDTDTDTELSVVGQIKPETEIHIRITPYESAGITGAPGVRYEGKRTAPSNLKMLGYDLTVNDSGVPNLVFDTPSDVLSVKVEWQVDGGGYTETVASPINEIITDNGVQYNADPTDGTVIAAGETLEVRMTPYPDENATGTAGVPVIVAFSRPSGTATIPPGSIASDDLIAAQRRYTIALQTPGDKVFSATGTNTITWGAFNIVFLDGATSPIPVDTAESPLTLLTSNTTYIYVDSSDSYNVKQTTNPASMGSDDYLVAIAKDDTYRAFVVGVDAQGEINAARINAVDLNAIVTNTGALNVSDMLTIDSGGGLKFGTGEIGTNFTGFYMRNASGTYEFVGENANVEQVKITNTGTITSGEDKVVLDYRGITITANSSGKTGGDKSLGETVLNVGGMFMEGYVSGGYDYSYLEGRGELTIQGQAATLAGEPMLILKSYDESDAALGTIQFIGTTIDVQSLNIKDSNDATGSTGQVLSQDIGGVIWAAPLTISANTGSNQAQSTQTALTVTGTGGIATTISGSTLTIDGSAIGGGGYTDWELWTEGVLRKTVTDGEPVNFTGVGGIAVTYGTNTVQIDGSGITGSYNWKVKTDESVALTVNSGVEILFSDGAGMSVTRSGQTINIATTALLGLDVAGTTGTGEIVEGETFTITGINGISTAMSGNTLTIDGAGVSGGTMDSWFVQVNGGVGYEIAEAGVLDFVQGNNMSITKTGTDELTFAVTGVMVNFTLNPSSGAFNPTVSNSSIITLTAGSGMTVEGTSATDITFTNTGVLDVKIDSDTNSATSLTKTAGAVTVDIVGGTGITTSHAGGVITVSATTGAPTTLSRSIVHSGGGWYDLWVAGTANDYLGEEFGTDRVTRVSGWVLSTEQTSDKASYHEFRAAIKTDATGDQTILFADEENLGDESTGHLIQLAIVNNTETGSLDKVSLQVKSISNTTTKWSSEIVFTELTNY